jgi:hypothetical protein
LAGHGLGAAADHRGAVLQTGKGAHKLKTAAVPRVGATEGQLRQAGKRGREPRVQRLNEVVVQPPARVG